MNPKKLLSSQAMNPFERISRLFEVGSDQYGSSKNCNRYINISPTDTNILFHRYLAIYFLMLQFLCQYLTNIVINYTNVYQSNPKQLYPVTFRFAYFIYTLLILSQIFEKILQFLSMDVSYKRTVLQHKKISITQTKCLVPDIFNLKFASLKLLIYSVFSCDRLA